MNAYVYVFAFVALILRVKSSKDRFFTIDDSVDRTDASRLCSNKGGVLPSLHDSDDYDSAKESCESGVNALSDPDSVYGCWMGLTDDRWYNDDGTELDYLFSDDEPNQGQNPWGVAQPNVAYMDDPDCVYFNADDDYMLYDDKECSDSNILPVCECTIDDALHQCSNVIVDIEQDMEDLNTNIDDLSTVISNNLFFVIDNAVEQENANDLCEEKGGKIASFHNDAEFNVARALCIEAIQARTDDTRSCWTGIKENDEGGIYHNEDESDADYMLDSDGLPNTGVYPWGSSRPNHPNIDHNCVAIDGKYVDYELNDLPCNQNKLPVCRYSNTVIETLITDNSDSIIALGTRIDDTETLITDLGTRIDNLVITDSDTQNSPVTVFGFDPTSLIQVLLVLNMFTIIFAVCCYYSMQKRSKYQPVKTIYSSDDQYQEQIQLK